ncbi:M56 family metallopeptidase [Nocardiopsis alborubida]|uniref:M56 family metallopeptidase n=1 Tax=Nocardiopsis alborubida TaxID=146802 RepID=A0A7X6MD73_9ACTN|nr:M56 family metallopeptidase [Nocardiopsis alborubida]NKY99081.1 M56 family metallopeptidase [Nocardiopsis alborubida]
MSWLAFVPAVLLTALSLVLAWKPLPVHPAWSARILAISAVTTALAVLSTTLLVAAAYIVRLLPADSVLSSGRGRLLLDHGPMPTNVGLMALLLLAVGLFGTIRVGTGWWRDMRAVRRDATTITGQSQPVAVAVPGRRGGVLLSKGMMRMLSRQELQVVFRHEHSHLRHRHHVYTVLGAFSAAIFPPLNSLHRSLRLAVERWADEDAAAATGDRELVARTIARVALAAPVPRSTWHLAFAQSQVVHRVEALLGDAPSDSRVAGPALLSSTGVASGGIASSCVQLHHLFALLLI